MFLKPVEQTPEETDVLFVVGVGGKVQVDPHRQDVLGIETRVDAVQLDQAPNHQSGADEQHERDRHLGHDEAIAGDLLAQRRGRTAEAFAKRLHQGSTDRQGRQQTEHQAG